MMEDRILLWKFRRGSREALRRIYEKYRTDLLKLAVSLVTDVSSAEDVVQDVFGKKNSITLNGIKVQQLPERPDHWIIQTFGN